MDEARERAPDALARAMCERHMGVGADGLILYERTADGARMRLFNADGSRSEVSGNGVRGLAALLLEGDPSAGDVPITIHTEGGAWCGGRATDGGTGSAGPWVCPRGFGAWRSPPRASAWGLR